MEAALIGVTGSLLGVVLGWLLSRKTSREARQWEERQSVRQRQEAAAAELDGGLVEVLKVMPQVQMEKRAAAEPLAQASALLREAWARATVLADAEIARRVRVLDMTVFIAAQEVRQPVSESTNFWPLGVALQDVRNALAAFQRREELPEAQFPDVKELLELTSTSDGESMLWGVQRHLMELP